MKILDTEIQENTKNDKNSVNPTISNEAAGKFKYLNPYKIYMK